MGNRGREKTTQVIRKPNRYPNQNRDPAWGTERGKRPRRSNQTRTKTGCRLFLGFSLFFASAFAQVNSTVSYHSLRMSSSGALFPLWANKARSMSKSARQTQQTHTINDSNIEMNDDMEIPLFHHDNHNNTVLVSPWYVVNDYGTILLQQ